MTPLSRRRSRVATAACPALPHSFRGGTLLALHVACRRARLAALEAAVIYARETAPPWGVRLPSRSVSLPIETHNDPIGGDLSRCSRRALVYSIDRDAVSSAATVRVRGAAAHD